jgi:hypothetical protein
MHPTRAAVPGSAGSSRIAVMLRAVGTTVDGAGRHSRPAAGPFRKIIDSSSSPARPVAKAAGDYEGRPLRNVVDKRLGYVGSAPRVGTSREGGIG